MKKFAFLVLLALALGACAPTEQAITTSMAVQIPLELKLAINALVLFGVTFGLQFVFDRFGLDLRGIGAAVAVAVAEFGILQLQGLINVIPAQFDTLIMIVLNVILAILTTLGYIQVAFRRERANTLFASK
jgi:hypothetical protein